MRLLLHMCMTLIYIFTYVVLVELHSSCGNNVVAWKL